MSLTRLIRSKKRHAARLSSRGGAAGERAATRMRSDWLERPRGKAMKNLLQALRETGIEIKATSFDAIALPRGMSVDLQDLDAVRAIIDQLTFIEIKRANQERVRSDFGGFFFALTENEILAAEQLGDRHRVALYNAIDETLLITSVPELLRRAKSTTWQVSIQL